MNNNNDMEITTLRKMVQTKDAQILTMSFDIKELRAAVRTLADIINSLQDFDIPKPENYIRAMQIARALKYEDSEQ